MKTIYLTAALSLSPCLLAADLELNTSQAYAGAASYENVTINNNSTIDLSGSINSSYRINIETGSRVNLNNSGISHTPSQGDKMATIGGGSIVYTDYRWTEGGILGWGMPVASGTGAIIAHEGYGEISGNTYTRAGGSGNAQRGPAGSVNNMLFSNGARLEALSGERNAISFNNVTFDLRGYETGTGKNKYELAQSGTNYTLDMNGVLDFGVNTFGGWDPATAKARVDGDLTIVLSDEQMKDIQDNATSFTLVLGNFTYVENSHAYPSTAELINELSSITIKNADGSISYTQTSGNYINGFKVDFIPEPSTATLSLLALAGLAARRRRL